MNKTICIIDNDFYLTLPVIKGLVKYRSVFMKESVDKIKIIFCLICPIKKEDELLWNNRINEFNKRYLEEEKEYEKYSDMIIVKYYPLITILNEPRNIELESNDIVTKVNDIICQEDGCEDNWDDFQENHLLYLLDLALEFKKGDAKELEDKRASLGRGIFYILKDKRVKLFSTYSDELDMWNKFQDNYEKAYHVKVPSGMNPMSRSGLNPQQYKYEYGKELLEWDLKK